MYIYNLHIFYYLTCIILKTTSDTLYCSLHFIVDYPLWTLTFTTRADHDYFRTNTLLTTYIYRNVEGLNELYNHYRFPYTSNIKNVTVQFFVHGITVVTDNICNKKNLTNNPLEEFCSSDINSDALLDLIVRYSDYDKQHNNNEQACLYYGLTSRKLKLQNNQGIALGWSWRGHLCSELREINNWSPTKSGFNPRYYGNVGLVTVSFDASDYSLNKGEMTFFHEIGHSMNAHHDDDGEFKYRQKECNPSEEQGGSYLMYPSGTDGLLPNNRAYSHCTLDTISKYMETLSQSKPKCLSTTKKVQSKCDGILSSGEICDEHGTSSNCCTSDCKLKPHAICSPSTGSCCQSSCQFYPSGYQCLAESECKMAVTCLGTSANCPDYDTNYFKPDKTLCRNGTLLCRNGSCQVSICTLYSLLPCQLKEREEQLCMIGCLNTHGLCIPYHTIDTNPDSSKILYLPYGSSCNTNQGFCDPSHKCLPLLLDDSINLISTGFSSLLLTNYTAIFKQYWWAFLLIILMQIILIPIVLFYFRSQCIPSDNPFLQ
ncbi:unnamed protein product [Adineta steineri]|uniref:Disintegrin and metalloproteinase domain-containing protein 10 n=1 Tax=Adineta steineri TaxID=433720 RepID=A0A813PPU9_9BILA|nr:unnamed protein product [Adineta steineri]CAF3646405.1 unnamed protein product [Adineta steineri]